MVTLKLMIIEAIYLKAVLANPNGKQNNSDKEEVL